MQLFSPSHQVRETSTSADSQQQVKQELRRQIHSALQLAKDLPPDECLTEIRSRLLTIQDYCQRMKKTFIMVEETITCKQYSLGGSDEDSATLFRGPSEDASVAICVTRQGSLLHRNGCSWKIYRNVGDINPTDTDLICKLAFALRA